LAVAAAIGGTKKGDEKGWSENRSLRFYLDIWILEGVYFSLWAFGGPTQFSSNNCTGASSTTLRKTIFFPLKILI
jgi:hypothetical protein